MTQRDRDALRIALAFSAALVVAEIADLELTFIAPLTAGTLAAAWRPRSVLLALPAFTALLVVIAGLLAGLAGTLPLVLAVLLFGLFTLGFAASARPALAPLGLLALVTLATVTDVLMRYPEASGEIMGWMVRNVAIAAVCVWIADLLLPSVPQHQVASDSQGLLQPAAAAGVLLLATAAVWAAAPTAPAPILVGVIITLRADGQTHGRAALDRVLGALAGGAAAVVAAGLVEFVPTLPVLAAATMAVSWLIARQVTADWRWQGAASKALNAMAILQGQGLSALYDDADERFWIRLGSVLIGVGIALVALLLIEALGRRPAGKRWA